MNANAFVAGGLVALTLFLPSATCLARGEAMVVGYVAPEYKGKGLAKILVHARSGNAFMRDQLERRAADAIRDESDKRTTVVLALEVFPPIREYTQGEIDQKLSELGVNGVLFFDVSESSVGVSKGWGFSFGSYGGSGGTYSAATRFTKAIVELYEPSKKEIIWKGEADIRVKGGSEKSIKSSTKYLAKRVAALLERDGLYPVTVPPKNVPAE